MHRAHDLTTIAPEMNSERRSGIWNEFDGKGFSSQKFVTTFRIKADSSQNEGRSISSSKN